MTERMSFEASDFLASLYRPEAEDTAELGPRAMPAPPPLAPDGEPQPADPGPSGFDLSRWVRRPDVNGLMGLEAPDLPDWVAWWRRSDFEGLPEPVWPGYLGDPRGPREN